jgi:hypothetical protein
MQTRGAGSRPALQKVSYQHALSRASMWLLCRNSELILAHMDDVVIHLVYKPGKL